MLPSSRFLQRMTGWESQKSVNTCWKHLGWCTKLMMNLPFFFTSCVTFVPQNWMFDLILKIIGFLQLSRCVCHWPASFINFNSQFTSLSCFKRLRTSAAGQLDSLLYLSISFHILFVSTLAAVMARWAHRGDEWESSVFLWFNEQMKDTHQRLCPHTDKWLSLLSAAT